MIRLTDEEIIAESTKDGEYCQLAVDVGIWAAETQFRRMVEFIGGVFSEDKWQALLGEIKD